MTDEAKKPTDSERMLERVSMAPANAHAIVELTVSIRTDSWGPDCTVGQAVTQAVESAKQRLRNILDPPEHLKKDSLQGVKLLGARCVRVVCDAERK